MFMVVVMVMVRVGCSVMKKQAAGLTAGVVL